jgi:hypothetical protein
MEDKKIAAGACLSRISPARITNALNKHRLITWCPYAICICVLHLPLNVFICVDVYVVLPTMLIFNPSGRKDLLAPYIAKKNVADPINSSINQLSTITKGRAYYVLKLVVEMAYAHRTWFNPTKWFWVDADDLMNALNMIDDGVGMGWVLNFLQSPAHDCKECRIHTLCLIDRMIKRRPFEASEAYEPIDQIIHVNN